MLDFASDLIGSLGGFQAHPDKQGHSVLPKIIAGIRLKTKSGIRFRAQAAARLTLPSPSFGESTGRGENDAIRA